MKIAFLLVIIFVLLLTAWEAIASTYAVDEIKEYLQSTPTINETSLVDAILHANTRIVNRVAREERLSGMGTTAVVVAKVDDNLLWASVGDRITLWFNSY